MSVISIRVDRKIKELLEKAGVDVSREVKQFLQELAWRVELKERLKELDERLSKIPEAPLGFSSESVREDRESH
ncbi:MAG: VapB-type antitoxin [Candidatus Bathyarchaeia archaeon]